MEEFKISTKERYELVDITSNVHDIVNESGIEEGLVFIFTPHSTAGILITENEEGLKKDWVSYFKKMVSGNDFYHDRIDNNADSHILSGLLGQGKTLPIKSGKIYRGTWQNIFLADFDGPRERKVSIHLLNKN